MGVHSEGLVRTTLVGNGSSGAPEGIWLIGWCGVTRVAGSNYRGTPTTPKEFDLRTSKPSTDSYHDA